MIFLFKNKKITVDVFCWRKKVFDLFPITKPTNHIPKWWRNLPNLTDNMSTDLNMRNCAGFIDLYNQGYMMPLWAEFQLSVNDGTPKWLFSDNITVSESHPKEQYTGFLNEDYFHIKFNAPWLIVSKCKLKLLFLNPTWNNPNPSLYFTPPGIIDVKYAWQPNVNLFFKRENINLNLQPGIPLVHFIFLSDKKVNLKLQLIGKEEWFKKRNVTSESLFFKASHLKEKKIYKDNEHCPKKTKV